uniref:Uncharacterized protein AlNc14C650G12333 n=1 Tax=Albugo laibachii Nc14 TaxID=890382 RepID=F0X1M2_9STRA|nr:conserved hypothetical protein [Albugo laibachii Nc14]CCA27745.1 conserved hypothetical protein [Albugo laibachii Nc14]|eukprot:CCA27745.1 conserved hypothetical protein [Albugo laibachii Nc14]
MELSTVKVILGFARRWRVPARHEDIPNACVKADKEKNLDIYLRIPQGMVIPAKELQKLGTTDKTRLALRLNNSLYGIKQAGRLWSQLLHKKLEEIGFTQCTADMCWYHKHQGTEMIIAGVYVDDLLVTVSLDDLVGDFFKGMETLSIKDLGKVRKFLGMRVELSDKDGYTLD